MAIKAQALSEFTHDATPELEGITPREQDQDDDLARWKLFVDGSSNQHGCDVGLFSKLLRANRWNIAYVLGSKPPTMKLNMRLSSPDKGLQ